MRQIAACALACALVFAIAAAPARGDVRARTFSADDPATWSDRRLAGQLVMGGVDQGNLKAAKAYAKAGIGGVVIVGNNPPSDYAKHVAAARAAGPDGIAPFIASDEEGGRVQRLRRLIGRLPSAKVMGTWPRGKIESTARTYGAKMRKLGVPMCFGPVADVGVKGRYIEVTERSFSRDPVRASTAVEAWVRGMQSSGVLCVVKHWPGQGSATDTHHKAAAVPPLATLERRDFRPFEAAFRAGAQAVMVAHVTSKGLTEPGIPASLSPRALAYLRAQAGTQTVIVTDSLSMSAASSALHISAKTSAVRALRAGADVALVNSANIYQVRDAVAAAIASGTISRHQAEASARRVLALKARMGLIAR